MDAQFISASTIYILCADQERTLLEYDIKKKCEGGNPISTKKLQFTDEVVVGMYCKDSSAVLIGSQNGFRVVNIAGGVSLILSFTDFIDTDSSDCGIQAPDGVYFMCF